PVTLRLMRAILSAIAVFALAAPALAQSRLPAEGFADLNDRLSPAVVNIATSQRVEGIEDLPRFPPGSPMERLNEGQGEGGGAQITSLGSGFIISPDGVVVAAILVARSSTLMAKSSASTRPSSRQLAPASASASRRQLRSCARLLIKSCASARSAAAGSACAWPI
ncbi:MAG: hypothetical protein ABL932_13480, partial [Terricaulis sp.]